MRLLAILLAASAAAAAEPDWPVLEKYALDLFQRYLRIESVNPPSDTRAAAALFEAELKKAGLAPRVHVSGPNGQTNLVVRLAGRDSSKKPLLLLNHFDVVPVDRKAWKVDPFGGVIRDGMIWGRGAMDMKGIGVMHLVALIAMKRAGVRPPRDIVMLSTADEETNGVYGIQWMIKNRLADIDAEYVIDEGGLGSREVFAPGRLVFGVAVGEKQVAWVKVRATGTAGHGSQPIADNANLTLLRALERALAQPGSGPSHPVVEEMRRAAGGRLTSNKYIDAIQRNTISLTTLEAGVGSPKKANVIPSTAEATLDCRLLPGVNVQEFLSEMRARINDPRVTVELTNVADDAGASDHRTPLFAAITAAIRKHHPEAAVTPMLAPHGTDSVKLRIRGVIAYGLTPMILDLATMGMHTDDERIPITEFLKGLRIYYDALASEW
jgi:acetylornithine deacetylase/succinyl-diaminopimelate desuccinylase-like protein